MLSTNESAKLKESIQGLLTSVDEYVKAQEVMKRGFLSSLSEKLQKLEVLLSELEEKPEDKSKK